MKKFVFATALVLIAASLISTSAMATETSVSLGDFSGGSTDGWGMQAWSGGAYFSNGNASTSLQVVNIGGVNALQGTLSASSTSPLNYDTDGGMVKAWDATGQAARFDSTKTVSLQLDFVNPAPSNAQWLYWVTVGFADGTASKATGWEFWPTSTRTFDASYFGVSNATFASMSSLQLTLPAFSATYGQGSYQNGSYSMALTGAKLIGTAAVPEPASLSALLLGLCGLCGLRRRSSKS